MTMAEWVRQALREARSDDGGTTHAKLLAIADAARHEYPTADIDVMLHEVEQAQMAT